MTGESGAGDPAGEICAVLIGSGRALAPAEIARVLAVDQEDVERVAEDVRARLAGVGLTLASDEKGRWLVAVGAAGRVAVGRLNGDLPGRRQLSTEAAETLALIQEKGPLTIKDMTRVRGANPRNALRTLLNLGLVQRAGRAEGRGGAWLYGALGGDAKIPWWFDSSSPERSGGGEKFAKNRPEPG